jgi:hypothetical protein
MAVRKMSCRKTLLIFQCWFDFLGETEKLVDPGGSSTIFQSTNDFIGRIVEDDHKPFFKLGSNQNILN